MPSYIVGDLPKKSHDLSEINERSSFSSWTFDNEKGVVLALDEEGEVWIIMADDKSGYSHLAGYQDNERTPMPTRTKIMNEKGLRAMSVKAGHELICAEVVDKETGRKRLWLRSLWQKKKKSHDMSTTNMQKCLDARVEPLINDGHYQIEDYWVHRTVAGNTTVNTRKSSMAVYLKHTAKGRALNVEFIRNKSGIKAVPLPELTN